MKINNLLFLILLLSLSSCVVDTQKAQPNILWITVEDISPILSLYGDSTANTPNLDRLAAESTIYTNAFTTVAVCAPARSSIITGMYPTSIGTQHMRTGKDTQGWGTRDYSGKSNAQDINGLTVPHYSVVTPPDVRCFTEYLRSAGYYCTNNPKTDYQFAAPVTAWDENGTKAHYRNRAKDQPFFSVFNLNVTHESFLWKNKDLPLTVHPDDVNVYPYWPDIEIVRNDIARLYSNIELMDVQIGKLLQDLEESDLLENTIIFFFSDHGGPLPRGKRANYESGLRVPMMVRFPDKLERKYDDQLISFVDLAPTVLSMANVEVPTHLQGEPFNDEHKREFVFASGDRFDEFTDRNRVVIDKEFIYVRNFHPELGAYKDVGYRKQIPMMNELLRLRDESKLNKDQMYWFRKKKTTAELYSRQNDVHNLKNIAGKKEYQERLSRMDEALNDWINYYGDKGAISETEMLAKMWPSGIQPMAEQPKVEIRNDQITVTHQDAAVSIAYLISDQSIEPDLDAGWKLYTEPVRLDQDKNIYVMATRIGFRDSEIVKIEK